MKKLGEKFILASLILLFIFLPVSSSASDPTPSPEIPDDYSEKHRELLEEIQRLELKVREIETRERTLATQIEVVDREINLTTLKIQEASLKIVQLEKEINGLSLKIKKLEKSLEELSHILVSRVGATYKMARVSPVTLFISSKGFSDFVSKVKYLRILQIHDKKLIAEMKATKENYSGQKEVKEEKQVEVEALKQKSERYKVNLGGQREAKENLLAVTRNDEKRYQQLLAAARAEQEAIEKAVSQALVLLKDGSPVEEGSVVALMGNSGYPCCSTGPHLHFEIRINGDHVNPGNYLRNYTDPNGVSLGSGSWEWPMSNFKISQEYGYTEFAKISGFYDFHTGVDMYHESNFFIKAPKGGTLYKGSTICGTGCPINFVAIDHGDGLISWYWHIEFS